MAFAALVPAIVQGIALIPSLITSFQMLFKKSDATPEEKAHVIATTTGAVIQTIGSVSTGGQKETMDKAASALPIFQDLMKNLMYLAELEGKPGSEKQQFVSGFMSDILIGWEKFSTGQQAVEVQTFKPIVEASINSLVPMFFPKEDPTAIENLHASD